MENHGNLKNSASRYGRMFPHLRSATFKEPVLQSLAKTLIGSPSDDNNSNIPAGYTYFGQFVDHDITRDARGDTIAQPVPDPITNIQLATPSLDLDSLYGSEDQYLNQYGRFTLKETDPTNVPSQPDLERSLSGRARIADPRNEDNLVVMHFHILFQQLHNKLYESREPAPIPEVAKWAKQQTVLHYQHLVLNDFLSRVLYPGVYRSVIIEDRCFFFHHEPGESPPMPVEFSGGAYRFGHSMVRDHYHWNKWNTKATAMDLLEKTGLGGHLGDQTRHSNAWYIDWSNFIPLDPRSELNTAKLIGPALSQALGELPHSGGGNLAYRNLTRGVSYGLPSGQDIQREMARRISFDELLTPEKIMAAGSTEQKKIYTVTNLHEQTPLWFYCLLESEILCEGQCLGPVASQIVAETLLNLIRCSSTSVLHSEFSPQDGELKEVIDKDSFELKHLVQYVSG